MKRPLVHAVLFLIAGQMLAGAFPMPAWALYLGLAVLCCGQAYLVRKTPGPGDPTPARGVLLFFAFALIGALGQLRIDRIDSAAQSAISSLDARQAVRIEGTVSGNPTERGDGWSVVLAEPKITQGARQIAPPSRIEFSFNHSMGGKDTTPAPNPPLPGQVLRATGKLALPDPPGNPYDFDYGAYLRAHNIVATLHCYSSRQFSCAEPPNGPGVWNRFQRVIQSYDRWSRQRIDRCLGSQWSPLLRAMLFGETNRLDPATKSEILRTGMAHFIAINGQHAALMGLLIFIFLRLFSLSWRLTWSITAILIWVFAAMVGFQAPVVRAAILATSLALAHVLDREPDSLNSLALAALLVLLIDPRSLHKADFQLSYLSVLSIIVLHPGLWQIFSVPTDRMPLRWRRIVQFFQNSFASRFVGFPLALTLAIQLGLVPLLIYYFHQLPLLGQLCNLIALPFAVSSIALGFLIITLGGLIAPLGYLLGAICGVLLAILTHLLHWFANLPLACVPMAPLPWWSIAAYYLILFGGCYMRAMDAPGSFQKGRARLLIAIAALTALVVWSGAFIHASRGELMVRLLDVGQGDSILLNFPGGQTMLIDGGTGTPADKGKSVVLPYLQTHGIQRLNAVVATHADNDHIGGLASVIRAVPTDLVLIGKDDPKSGVARQFDETIRQKAVPCYAVKNGDQIDGIDNCRVTVMNPQPDSLGDDNDDSVVLRVDYGQRSFLFTGDASVKAEQAMMADGENLDCDVLKAGHHGSASSSGLPFLDAVTPKIVLISVGAHNRYGHPAPAAMERFAEEHASIYRTDEEGSVAVYSDGETLRVETQHPPRNVTRNETRNNKD